ncbi:hypothetical protein HMPREF9456_02906 [Dysgonomonas mossii DSM 22836]|uniref:Uncharacterized protein n=1 Tax=Dysgonomonas mossii DSM 22836 TaxID=742767 RepID=F8X3U7_9BACT|nr:hypothetical protein HMPREF9456_02906 [Dysgonomonas mossii DSM 22836]
MLPHIWLSLFHMLPNRYLRYIERIINTDNKLFRQKNDGLAQITLSSSLGS